MRRQFDAIGQLWLGGCGKKNDEKMRNVQEANSDLTESGDRLPSTVSGKRPTAAALPRLPRCGFSASTSTSTSSRTGLGAACMADPGLSKQSHVANDLSLFAQMPPPKQGAPQPRACTPPAGQRTRLLH